MKKNNIFLIRENENENVCDEDDLSCSARTLLCFLVNVEINHDKKHLLK